MDKWLYILCEGERDEMFYEHLCERITGWSFGRPPDLRLRRGANWKTAIAGARLLMDRVKHWHEGQDIAVVIAVDNDRAPGHPGGNQTPRPLPPLDQRKPSRYAALQNMLNEKLGRDRSTWPVDVALAIPVEMIESWALLLLDPARPDLPLFAEASQKIAQLYYQGAVVPPQLKDLIEVSRKQRDVGLDELFWAAADSELEPACARSASLTLFADEVRNWRAPRN